MPSGKPATAIPANGMLSDASCATAAGTLFGVLSAGCAGATGAISTTTSSPIGIVVVGNGSGSLSVVVGASDVEVVVGSDVGTLSVVVVVGASVVEVVELDVVLEGADVEVVELDVVLEVVELDVVLLDVVELDVVLELDVVGASVVVVGASVVVTTTTGVSGLRLTTGATSCSLPHTPFSSIVRSSPFSEISSGIFDASTITHSLSPSTPNDNTL